jgi:hypothetical protein
MQVGVYIILHLAVKKWNQKIIITIPIKHKQHLSRILSAG